MEENWPGVNNFSAFSFRIKKIFKEPLQFVYMGDKKLAMGEFVEGVTLMKENLDYSDVAKAITIVEYEDKLQSLKSIEVEDEDKEVQKLFLELYELFLKRFSEKARHDPEEDARRRARRNRKKKPKKDKAEHNDPCPPGMVRDSETGRCVQRKSKKDKNQECTQCTEDKVECGNCKSYFDYGIQKEVAMGAVSCPNCKAILNQEGKTLELNNEKN